MGTDLDGVEAQGQGVVDGANDALMASSPSHAFKSVGAQRVQADVQQTQACVPCCPLKGMGYEDPRLNS
jgi:anaerobic glycerol-3-phosphate dehydrogenase